MMKKRCAAGAALAAVLILLSGCVTNSNVVEETPDKTPGEIYQKMSVSRKRKLIVELCRTYTPRNSVLVYGSCSTNGIAFIKNAVPLSMKFLQTDPAKPAQHLEYLGDHAFFYKPVSPGGSYRLYYSETLIPGGREYTYYGIQQGPTAFDFTAPEKPGLYYAGDFEINYNTKKAVSFSSDPKDSTWYRRTYEKNTSVYEHGEKKLSDCEKQSLEYILKFYKDTAWEPLIRARMEELKNAE
jgi:hypothetical protein